MYCRPVVVGYKTAGWEAGGWQVDGWEAGDGPHRQKTPICSPRPSLPEIFSQTELVLLLTNSLIMHSARSHCRPLMGLEPAYLLKSPSPQRFFWQNMNYDLMFCWGCCL